MGEKALGAVIQEAYIQSLSNRADGQLGAGAGNDGYTTISLPTIAD